jgi:hypothetical protein
VADKKALPHANDLARAIDAAFKEAQTVFLSPSEAAVVASIAKRHGAPGGDRAHVPKATKSVKLEKPLSTRRRSRRDTGLVTHND